MHIYIQSRSFLDRSAVPLLFLDVPFQLVYQRHYHQPLLTKAVVLAHDVDDFSKIWQAMGRSRTMNDTGQY